MNPSQDLTQLKQAALKRLARMRAIALIGLSSQAPPNTNQFSFVTIETQNLWSNFVRSYLLSCVFCPRRSKGGKVTLGNSAIQSPGDVLLAAARSVRGPTAAAPTNRREEPSWHDTSVFLKTASAIQCSHLNQIQGALSLQTRVLQDLPVFRNYYAHRNEETANKAIALASKQYLVRGYHHPTLVLAQPAYKRTQPIILDWLDDLRTIADLLCD